MLCKVVILLFLIINNLDFKLDLERFIFCGIYGDKFKECLIFIKLRLKNKIFLLILICCLGRLVEVVYGWGIDLEILLIFLNFFSNFG